jgi:asparagine synthase (glutamine-hydrolysing)
MCGIAGTIHFKDTKTLESMLDLLEHRGPDDRGVYYDAEQKVALGHCRLSIIDLSSAGHQPMHSDDESVWVTFNGELYNYKELTNELKEKGYVFNSNSDTEVLIHGYAEYGEDIFKKIDGMWAVAIYDKKAKKFLLSRDPSGIKPLYVYRAKDELLFSSEMGAMKRVLSVGSLTIHKASTRKFLAHGYLYGEGTIYNEILRVSAGSVLTYELPTLAMTKNVIYKPEKRFEVKSMQDAVTKFNELFSNSVRGTLQSDVPVGLFLSGGIDSALVGYHIREAGANLKAFTIGFPQETFDESDIATRIAQHLGFEHVVHVMRGEDVVDDIECILDAFGEPFADTSVLPTYYVSKLAREHGIEVALGGDGADELFGGYQTHYLPTVGAAYRLTPPVMDSVLHTAAGMLPSTFTKLGTKEKLTRFVHAVRNPYTRAHAQWKRVFTDTDLQELLQPDTYQEALLEEAHFDEFFDAVRNTSSNKMDETMKVDFYTFLQGSCLVKSDIASMQHGLELRLPFLNKDIIDFAWYLPTSLKVEPFKTKKLLRQALAPYLPKDISQIPKKGFVPPLASWLTKELKPAMLRILSKEEVAKVGFLRYPYVVTLIDDHLAMKADNSKKIWALMSLVRFFSTQ